MKWSPEHLALLQERYSDTSNVELGVMFNRSADAIFSKATKLKLKKSKEYLSHPECGRIKESPIGKEFTDRNGYVVRKVNNDLPYNQRWCYVHVMEWETHYGPVPEGYILRFKDGDKKNTDIGNLELITRKRNFELNSIHRYPKEVIEVIHLQKKFERTIEEMKNA